MSLPILQHRLTQNSQTQYTSAVTVSENCEYVNNTQRLVFSCGRGHTWTAIVSNMLLSTCKGCPVCNGKQKKTTQIFLDELTTRNNQYSDKVVNLVRGEHVNVHTKLEFICLQGHTWRAIPRDVLNGSGCKVCAKRGWSSAAIEWLEVEAITNKVHIQHAKNGGEYKIPSTRWYVDGFCESTNTVYEFYGDAFHGNPVVYTPSTLCHPYDKTKTAKQLYESTMRRCDLIRAKGYTVVEQWETPISPQSD